MSFGSTAYASYVRIRSESGERTFPGWEDLAHVRRLAWEAAAQAVALAVLPASLNPESRDEESPYDVDDETD